MRGLFQQPVRGLNHGNGIIGLSQEPVRGAANRELRSRTKARAGESTARAASFIPRRTSFNPAGDATIISSMRILRQITKGPPIALLATAILSSADSAVITFEKTSVKAHLAAGPKGPLQIIPTAGGGAAAGTFDRIAGTNVTVKQLIQSGFGLLESEISGPPWLDKDGYDVEARPAMPTGLEQIQAMLQAMLAGRFKLKSHRETKKLPIYWLIVAHGGSKLRGATEEEAFFAALAGKPPFRPGFGGIFSKKDLPGFAERLSRGIGRAVVDKTGIKGQYWFQIEWVADKDRPGIASPALLSSLKEQSGLTLEKHRGPTEVLIIDSVERPPR
jgi:uncharacterized protein (TIGR03435 family)